VSNPQSQHPQETHMYIGGGILGTILVIALIVFLVRRV
jgi:O-antigen ligase